jgi:hypothetical protein
VKSELAQMPLAPQMGPASIFPDDRRGQIRRQTVPQVR